MRLLGYIRRSQDSGTGVSEEIQLARSMSRGTAACSLSSSPQSAPHQGGAPCIVRRRGDVSRLLSFAPNVEG